MGRPEFGEIMAYLARGVGKSMAADQAEVYFDLLGDLPADALRLAAKRSVLESQYPTIPPVGVLRSLAAEAMTGADLLPTPMEAWELLRKAVVRFGYMREAQGLASLPPVVRRAAECLGWQDVCNSEDPGVVRAHFRQAYETIAEREKRTALLPAPVKKMLHELADAFAMPDDRPRGVLPLAGEDRRLK